MFLSNRTPLFSLYFVAHYTQTLFFFFSSFLAVSGPLLLFKTRFRFTAGRILLSQRKGFKLRPLHGFEPIWLTAEEYLFTAESLIFTRIKASLM